MFHNLLCMINRHRPTRNKVRHRANTYTSATWGYSVSYPATWYNLPNSGAPDTDKYFSNENVSAPMQMTNAGVWLTIRTISGACPPPQGRIDGQAQLTVGGQSVTRTYGYFGPPGAEPGWTIDAAVARGSSCFTFGYFALTQPARDNNLDTTGRMITSFQFL